MVYNSGTTTDYDKINNYEEAAKIFSEGDKNLENLLLYCFSSKIKTIGCCCGHLNKNKLPYIAFKYNEFNKQFIYYLIHILNEYNICFSFNRSFNGFIFSVYNFKSEFNLFEKINASLKSFDKFDNYELLLAKDLQEYINMMEAIYNNNILVNQFFQLGYNKENNIYCYKFALYGLKKYDIIEKSGFEKHDSPHAVYYIYSKDRIELGDKLEITRLNLEESENKKVI